MTTLPTSGKSGFLIGRASTGGIVYVPIYFWQINITQNRPSYRKSNSANYPSRRGGTFDDTIVIRGVSAQNQDYLNTIFNAAQVNFEIGWIDFAANVERYIPCTGMLTQIVYEFIYARTTQPSFMWTATFEGVAVPKVVLSRAIGVSLFDFVLCSPPQCTLSILDITTTTILAHIRNASATLIHERSNYKTSNSNNRRRASLGVLDTRVELTIEGNFDYWTGLINSNLEPPHSYALFFGTGPTDYVNASFLVPTRLYNFVTNVQTAEISSANLTLEASVG